MQFSQGRGGGGEVRAPANERVDNPNKIHKQNKEMMHRQANEHHHQSGPHLRARFDRAQIGETCARSIKQVRGGLSLCLFVLFSLVDEVTREKNRGGGKGTWKCAMVQCVRGVCVRVCVCVCVCESQWMVMICCQSALLTCACLRACVFEKKEKKSAVYLSPQQRKHADGIRQNAVLRPHIRKKFYHRTNEKNVQEEGGVCVCV